MLNPVSRSKAEEKLGIKARDSKIWARIEQNPLRLDLLVISTYVDNWRSALTELAEIFQEQVSISMNVALRTVSDFYLAQIHLSSQIQRRRRFSKNHQFYHHEQTPSTRRKSTSHAEYDTFNDHVDRPSCLTEQYLV